MKSTVDSRKLHNIFFDLFPRWVKLVFSLLVLFGILMSFVFDSGRYVPMSIFLTAVVFPLLFLLWRAHYYTTRKMPALPASRLQNIIVRTPGGDQTLLDFMNTAGVLKRKEMKVYGAQIEKICYDANRNNISWRDFDLTASRIAKEITMKTSQNNRS